MENFTELQSYWKSFIDYELYQSESTTVTTLQILMVFLLFFVMRFFLAFAKRVVSSVFLKDADPDRKRDTLKTTVSAIYVIYLICSLQILGLIHSVLIKIDETIKIHVYHIVYIIFFLLVTRFVLEFLKSALVKYIPTANKSAENRKNAILQIVAYVVYVIFALTSLQYVGIDLSLLVAGAAALLVGLGFGLQQIFNDLVSGLIILFEGNVNTGDIVGVDDRMGRVEVIGLRATSIKTHEQTTFVVPNSQLVSDRVHNYSYGSFTTRFKVSVGVAYGSDLSVVKSQLLLVAKENDKVVDDPAPFVRFVDFGSSSLDFELHFWTERIWGIEDVQSDIRFAIDAAFRANGVTIPFPQRDLHIMSSQVPLA